MDEPVPIGELEQAINRARAALPSIGAESVLTLELSTLAALYGRLIYERRDGVSPTMLSPAERIALGLWRPRRPGSSRSA